MPTDEDLEQQLRAYRRVLERPGPVADVTDLPVRATRPRISGRVLLAAAAALVLVVGAVVVLDDDDDKGSGVDVVDDSESVVPRILTRLPGYGAPFPLAVAGGDVWRVAEEAIDGYTPAMHHIERRDARTAELLDVIPVSQEAVFGIAGTEDALFVAGGGDGAVPDTSVSRIDLATKEVTTRTLETSCSCEVVAGPQFVWLGGNGSSSVLELDQRTLELAAEIDLGAPARTIDLVDAFRVHSGMEDGRIVYFDPMTDYVFPPLDLGDTGDAVNAVIPAHRSGQSRDDSFVATRNGMVYEIIGSETIASSIDVGFAPSDGAVVGDDLWLVGGNKIARVHDGAVDVTVLDQAGNYQQVVAADDTLWIFDSPEGGATASILVVSLSGDDAELPATPDTETPNTVTPTTDELPPVEGPLEEPAGAEPVVVGQVTLAPGSEVIGASDNEVFVTRRVYPDEADNNNDRIERRDARTGEIVQTLDAGLIAYEGALSHAILSEDGKSLFVSGYTSDAGPMGGVSKIDLESGQVVFTKEFPHAGFELLVVDGSAWTVRGNAVAPNLALWRLDPETGEVVDELELPSAAEAVAPSPEGFVVAMNDGGITFVDPETLEIAPVEGGCRATANDRIVVLYSGASTHVVRESGADTVMSPDSCETELTPFTGGRVAFLNGQRWGTTDNTLDSTGASWLWQDDHFVSHGMPSYTEAPPEGEVQPPQPPTPNGFGTPVAAEEERVLWIPINATDDVLVVAVAE